MSQVAQTILAQLGGNKFLAMTGAKLVSTPDSLRIKIKGRGCRGPVNWIAITSTRSGNYVVEALFIRGFSVHNKECRTGTTADQLQNAFTEMTGLDTHL